ncbi:hypothetical protein MVEG_01598 [Podila verticillata NRRL 6337]|nr:hypothetical protein MVEG_01598 [Podila verticillata NRRL 6337]
MSSRVVMSEVSGPAIRFSHSHTKKRYHSTIDQAREYAAELGPGMAFAFDELSHKTALVLHAYITAVSQEGHSYSETEFIRDAMKQFFEDTFGCRGEDWKFVPDRDEYNFIDEAEEEERGHWTGNPVFDPAFASLMQDLKAQEERSEGTRYAKRRMAIGYEDMAKLALHLQKPAIIKAEGEGHSLFFQAFSTTAFALWLTFEEVLKLKRGYFRFRRSDSNGSPWVVVTVPFRNSNPIDTSQANVYEIYPQKDEPHSCCVTKLLAWLQWIEMQQGRQLMADDFLFPALTNDDSIQLKKLLSVTQLSTLMNKYANDAGLMDHRYTLFDTHCFRRGGAQHQFVHTQDKWPFQAVRWWGGWSEEEPAEKILEYLLDNSQYEASFGDMMSPHRGKTRGHTGSTRLNLEVQAMKEVVQSMDLRHTAALSRIEKENQDLRQQMTKLESTITQKLDKAVHTLTSRAAEDMHHPKSSQSLPPVLSREQSQPTEQQSKEQQHTQQQHKQQARQQPSPQQESYQQESESETENSYIPPVAHWQEAIQQWEVGDPENGLTVPLCDWDVDMRRGQRRYYDCKLVAQEFENHGRNEDKMRQVYGDSLNGEMGKLLIAIRLRRDLGNMQPLDECGEKDLFSPSISDDESDQEYQGQPQSTIPKISNWREAVQQWEEGDPDNGLMEPLCKWTTVAPKCRATHATRKLIANEFDFFKRDEHKMREVHGKNMDRVRSLIESIRKRPKRQEQPEYDKTEGERKRIQRQRDGYINVVDDGDTTEEEQPAPLQQGQHHRETIVPGTGIISTQRVPRLHSWKDAVRQWEDGDPVNGLTLPFRDWPAAMLKKTSIKRIHSRRERIVNEFEFFGRDEELMRQEHGRDMDTIDGLISAILSRRYRQQQQQQQQHQQLRIQPQDRLKKGEQGQYSQPGEKSGAEIESQVHQEYDFHSQEKPQPRQGEKSPLHQVEDIQPKKEPLAHQGHPLQPEEEPWSRQEDVELPPMEDLPADLQRFQEQERQREVDELQIHQWQVQQQQLQEIRSQVNQQSDMVQQPQVGEEEEPLTRKRRITFEDEGQSPTKKTASSSE